MPKNTNKDKAMAAYLKKHNVRRNTGRCPICYKIVGIETAMVNHIAFHK